MKRLALTLLFALSMWGQAPTTHIVDTVYTGIGIDKWSGKIIISAPDRYYGSIPLVTQSTAITVSAGAIDVSLVPNDVVSPEGTTYTVEYRNSNGAQWKTETWYVPSSGSTLTLGDVVTRSRISNNLPKLPLSQLALTGCTDGFIAKVMTGQWTCAAETGGTGGGGGTWGTIVGTLSAQTDLWNALGGKASTTHASTHGPAGSDPISGLAMTQITGLITAIGTKVDNTITVNGHALNANVTVAKADLGLGNVENYSAASLPLSDAATAALALKLTASNNLSDISSATVARVNLGMPHYVDPSVPGTTDPSGACTALQVYLRSDTQEMWDCTSSGTWKRRLSTLPGQTVLITGSAGTTPGTQAAGVQAVWFDMTAGVPQSENENGEVGTMVKTKSVRTPNTFLTHVDPVGTQNYAAIAAADLPVASASSVGGVKCGSGTACAADGTISASATAGVNSIGGGTGDAGVGGNVKLVAGTDIQIVRSGQNITITNTGGGGGGGGSSHIIPFQVDGGGSTPATGDIKVYVPVPYACTITGGTVTADQSGSISVDVWKAAGAIPTSGNKISATAPMALSAAQYNGSIDLTGWTTAVSAGDVFGFSIASASTLTSVRGQLFCDVASTAPHVINISIDGRGSAITTGALGVFVPVNYACTITGGAITSDQSGSISIDVWKAAGAIPTSGDKISASAPLSLSTAQYNGSPSLTGWTTTVTSGDVFGFSVASAATVTRVTGQLYCQ